MVHSKANQKLLVKEKCMENKGFFPGIIVIFVLLMLVGFLINWNNGNADKECSMSAVPYCQEIQPTSADKP